MISVEKSLRLVNRHAMYSTDLVGRLADGVDVADDSVNEKRFLSKGKPMVKDLVKLLPAEEHVFRFWYRSKNIRERIGAIKNNRRIYFDRQWYDSIKNQVGRKKMITAKEATKILDVSKHKVVLTEQVYWRDTTCRTKNKALFSKI